MHPRDFDSHTTILDDELASRCRRPQQAQETASLVAARVGSGSRIERYPECGCDRGEGRDQPSNHVALRRFPWPSPAGTRFRYYSSGTSIHVRASIAHASTNAYVSRCDARAMHASRIFLDCRDHRRMFELPGDPQRNRKIGRPDHHSIHAGDCKQFVDTIQCRDVSICSTTITFSFICAMMSGMDSYLIVEMSRLQAEAPHAQRGETRPRNRLLQHLRRFHARKQNSLSSAIERASHQRILTTRPRERWGTIHSRWPREPDPAAFPDRSRRVRNRDTPSRAQPPLKSE